MSTFDDLMNKAQAIDTVEFVYCDVRVNDFGTHIEIRDAEPVTVYDPDTDEEHSAPAGEIVVRASGRTLEKALKNAMAALDPE